MVFYMSVVVYAPAVTLHAVTHLSKWGAILSVGIVCTFYCTLGMVSAILNVAIVILFIIAVSCWPEGCQN